MKLIKYISAFLIPCLVLGAMIMSSCVDEDGVASESPNGAPSISYIRLSDATKADSLLESASLGANIFIVGENLGGIQQVWFNDRRASLNPTFVTNNNIYTTVPSLAPKTVVDHLFLISGTGDTLAYPFKVAISAPEVYSARNEWPQEGENLVITGEYFFEPAVVTFTGGLTGEVISLDQNTIEVSVPEGATEGPITVSTNFGSGESTFMLWDRRNIILNFDDLVGNGWRQGLTATNETAIDGNYLYVGGNINANQRVEGDGASPYLMEFWGINGTRPEGNFYNGNYEDYVLKFEAKVNMWYGGYLNICLAPWNHKDSNQEIWSNDINARAIWGPWSDLDKEFKTDGWITVVIPMTEFKYSMGTNADGVVYEDLEFNKDNAGSISTWLLGSPESDGSKVEFFIDNMRIVKP